MSARRLRRRQPAAGDSPACRIAVVACPFLGQSSRRWLSPGRWSGASRRVRRWPEARNSRLSPVDGRGPSEKFAGRCPDGALIVPPRMRAVPPARSASARRCSRRPPARKRPCQYLVPRVGPPRRDAQVEVIRRFPQAQVMGDALSDWPPGGGLRREPMRSGWLRGSLGCSLFWGRFAVTKPLSQIHGAPSRFFKGCPQRINSTTPPAEIFAQEVG